MSRWCRARRTSWSAGARSSVWPGSHRDRRERGKIELLPVRWRIERPRLPARRRRPAPPTTTAPGHKRWRACLIGHVASPERVVLLRRSKASLSHDCAAAPLPRRSLRLEPAHIDVVERHRLGRREVEAEADVVPGRQLAIEALRRHRTHELLDRARNDDAAGIEESRAGIVERLDDVLLERIVAERLATRPRRRGRAWPPRSNAFRRCGSW